MNKKKVLKLGCNNVKYISAAILRKLSEIRLSINDKAKKCNFPQHYPLL